MKIELVVDEKEIHRIVEKTIVEQVCMEYFNDHLRPRKELYRALDEVVKEAVKETLGKRLDFEKIAKRAQMSATQSIIKKTMNEK